jgi:glycosyltransferase involved in cell wall biosynthesis
LGLTILLDGDPAAPQQARLGAALAERGHRVVVLDAPRIAEQIRDEFKQPCEAVAALPAWTGPLRVGGLRKLARKLRIDVVHLNFLKPPRDAWVAPGMPPVVATAWGSDLNEEVFARSPAFRAAVDRILRGAKAVTADSLPLLRQCQQRGAGRDGRPCELVPWSADLARWQPDLWRQKADALRATWGVRPGQKVLLAPRQMQPHYRADLIMQAFALSKWRLGAKFVLKLHGKAGEDAWQATMSDLVYDLAISHLVHVADRCSYDDLPAVYGAADAAVSAVDQDGLPSTFCELAAMRVPIVASDLPAYEGVLVHDERALLFRPGNVPDLVRQLDRLWDEPELGARLAAGARAWALEHGDWGRSVDAWERLYRGAIAAQTG